MNRQVLSALTGAAMLLGSATASATAHSVEVREDTYVRRDNAGPFGSETQILLKNRDSADMTRKGVLRFAMGWTSYSPMEASISLDVVGLDGLGSATFNVFGINTPLWSSADCGTNFTEENLRYRDLPFLDDSADGVDNRSTCIYKGAPLGQLVVKSTDVGHTVTFSSTALREYIRDNSSYFGVAMFVITKVENDSHAPAFASKENTTLNAPRLSWTDPDDLAFEGTSQPSPSTNDTPQRFVGNLKLPLPNGEYVTLPGADVTVTYSANKVKTINGTVGMPQLPQTGLFKEISLSGPTLSIGYDYPRNFNNIGLPLDEANRYFFLTTSADMSVDVANLVTLSSPAAGGSSLLAFDPSTATFFGYSSQIPFGELPIEDVAVGFSGGNNIPFVPWESSGVSTQMAQFQNGNFYLGGTLGFDLDKYSSGSVSFGASIAGDMTVNVDPTGFASKSQDWLRDLGLNGSVSIDLGIGDYAGMSYQMGQGSLLYRRYSSGGTQPSFTFAGAVQSPGTGKLPFTFKGTTDVAGYVDLNNSGAASFVQLTGDLDFGSRFLDADLSGLVKVAPSGATFDGKVKFVGFKVDVNGTITPSSVSVGGKAVVNWTYAGYGVEAKIRPAVYIDGSGGKVSFDGSSAKACVAGDCSGITITRAYVTSDGHVKFCVKVAGDETCAPL